MQSLDDYVTENFGPNAAIEIDSILFSCGFPMAEKGECITDKEAALVFLNDFGLVNRFAPKPDYDENPYVLQPLKSVNIGGGGVMEVVPGIEAICAEKEDLLFLQHKLLDHNCYFWDAESYNCGYARLDDPSDVFERGMPLVLDRGAVRRVSDGEREKIRSTLAPLPEKYATISFEGLQDHKFSTLKASLNDAWPEGKNQPEEGKITSFFSLCAGQIANCRAGVKGILSNAWAKNRWVISKEELRDNHSAAKVILAGKTGCAYSKHILKDGDDKIRDMITNDAGPC